MFYLRSHRENLSDSECLKIMGLRLKGIVCIMIVKSFALVKFYAFAILYVLVVVLQLQIKRTRDYKLLIIISLSS